MTSITQDINPQHSVKRIGLVVHHIGELHEPALRFLVLQMNSRQQTFEYEFLPSAPADDRFLQILASNYPVDRQQVKVEAVSFYERFLEYLRVLVKEFKLKEEPPQYFIIITLARFSDNYYSTRRNGVSVLALGDWQRSMAPPSIIEFLLTLIVREAVSSISRSLRGSIHLGTKGCLFDFTPSLDDVRNKVLNAFVCAHCRRALEADGFGGVADELVRVLGKDWLGKSTDPNSPAGITSNLGYDLFMTKGLKPVWWERLLVTIQEEGVKQLLGVVGALIIAALVIVLGLK